MEKKLYDLNHGICEGERCNRNGCHGRIELHRTSDCCSCHIHPPCSYCVNAIAYCNICGFEEDDTHDITENVIPSNTIKFEINEPIYPTYDPKPIYEVVRYFDDIYEATVKSNLDEKTARNEAIKYANSKPRHYVSFGVRKMKFSYLEWIKNFS